MLSAYARLITYLPLSGYISATPPSGPASDEELWESPLYGVPTRSVRSGTMLMQIVGHSMDDGSEKAIQHGSIVLVDQFDMEVHQMRYGYTYALVTLEGAIIAKQFDLYRGRPALISLNKAYEPITNFRQLGYEPVGLLYGVRVSDKVVRSVMP